MTLTIEERAAQNRINSQRSSGPKTAQGKARSRANALKHGLRADALPMPGQDPAIAARRSQVWNDYYDPQSPGAQHLLNECVRLTLDCDYIATLKVTAAHTQHERLTADRQAESQGFIDENLERLSVDTVEVIAALKGSLLGCRWLIEFWTRLGDEFARNGHIQDRDIETGYYLLGRRNSNATNFQRNARALLPGFPFDPRLGDLPAVRDRVAAMIAAELNSVRAVASSLDESADNRALTASCVIPDDPVTARLILRYQAEARSAFLRAFKALEATLARDAAADREYEPAEIESPNEAKPAAVVSPNEPDPVFEAALKQAVARARVVAPRVQGDPTVRDRRGLPTNVLNMFMVPVS